MQGRERAKAINIRSEMTRRRSGSGKAIDWVGTWLAHPWLFVTLIFLHLGWVVVNLGVVPGIRPWDPPPFTLLATIASVEAPFLSVLILMRQHRDERIAELRQEVLLQVALDVEGKIARHVEEEPLDVRELMESLIRRLDEEEGHIQGEKED